MPTADEGRHHRFVALTNSVFAAGVLGTLLLMAAQSGPLDLDVRPSPGTAPPPWPARLALDFPECSPIWSPDAADAVLVVDEDGTPRKVPAERVARLLAPPYREPVNVVGFCAKKSPR